VACPPCFTARAPSQMSTGLFCGVKFRAKFEVLLQKKFLSVAFDFESSAFKINWIGLFYFKLNRRKWQNSFSVFQRNSPKHSNDQRSKLDWNWLTFYGKRNTGSRAITAPSYKQPNKLSQFHTMLENSLKVTFLAISKWTEINLCWLIVDGCVKEGKRLTITVNF